MEQNLRELIPGQIAKADEKLNAAKALLRGGFLDDAISRAYYAIFHAASAVLLSEGMNAESHSALKDLFGLHFIKTGKIERKFGRILNRLKDDRETGDYDIYAAFDKADAENSITMAEEFLVTMRRYLTDAHGFRF